MQVTKQSVPVEEFMTLTPLAKKALLAWMAVHNITELRIGDLIQFIIENHEKENLFNQLVIWVKLGGELVDILWDFARDIAENKCQQ